MAVCSFLSCRSNIKTNRTDHHPYLCLQLPDIMETRESWLEVLGNNDIVPTDGTMWICSQHFGEIHPDNNVLDLFRFVNKYVYKSVSLSTVTPSISPETKNNQHSATNKDYLNPRTEIQSTLTCHTCLAQTATLLSPSLAAAFTQTTGVSVAEARLPCALCATCAAYLHKAARFREASARADLVLRDLAQTGQITPSTIAIKRNQLTPILPQYSIEQRISINISGEYDCDNEINIKQELYPSTGYICEVTMENVDKYSDNSLTDDDVYLDSLKAEDTVEVNNQGDFLSKIEDLEDIPLSELAPFKNKLKIKTKKKKRITAKEKIVKKEKVKKEILKYKKRIDKSKERTPKVRTNDTMQIEKIRDVLNVMSLSKEEQIAEHERKKESNSYISCEFKCELCYTGFRHEKTLQTHSVRHSKECGDYVCEICKAHFMQKLNLNKHMKNHKYKFECKRCDFTTFFLTNAWKHYQWHNGIVYNCEICKIVFDHSTSYINHNRIKHSSDHVCGYCGYSFLGEKGLLAHRKKKHSHETIAEGGPRCVDCDIVFSNETAFITHQRISPKHGGNTRNDPYLQHTKAKSKGTSRRPRNVSPKPINQRSRKMLQQYNEPIACEQCGHQVFTKRDYSLHFNKYHPNSTRTVYPEECKAQLCDICGKTFEGAANYLTHRAVEHAPSTFKCDICQKEFRLKAYLNNHVLSIHKGKRHACPICGKTFTSSGNRDRHYTYVHSSVKDVKCDHCDKYFKNKEDQKFHIKYVHFKIPYNRNVPRNRPGCLPPSKRRRRDDISVSSSEIEMSTVDSSYM